MPVVLIIVQFFPLPIFIFTTVTRFEFIVSIYYSRMMLFVLACVLTVRVLTPKWLDLHLRIFGRTRKISSNGYHSMKLRNHVFVRSENRTCLLHFLGRIKWKKNGKIFLKQKCCNQRLSHLLKIRRKICTIKLLVTFTRGMMEKIEFYFWSFWSYVWR